MSASSPLRTILITSGGLGLLRPAPGTWGSLPPAGLAWLLLLLGTPPLAINMALLLVLALSSIICLALGRWAEARFGRKDASQIVIDETAGQCLPLLFWPASFSASCSLDHHGFWRASFSVSAAFLLFRILDILKPPPAYRLQRLAHGQGVLADDLAAGAYAALGLQLLTRLI